MDLKLEPKQQLIAAAIGIAIVAGLFAFFLIVPQFRQMSALDAQMQKAEADIVAAQQLLSVRQEAKSAAAETQARLTRLDNQIPDAPELAALIIDLQNTADDAGVAWDKLAPTKPGEEGDGFQKIALNFTVAGRWDDLVEYTRRLAGLERAVRILSVQVTPEKTGASATTETANQPQKLTAQFSIEVYSLPRAGGTTQAAPGAPKKKKS
jgi:Tfp pilus assembly protein PilO